MDNSLAMAIPKREEIATRQEYAGQLVQSGLLPKHIKTREQAIAIMQLGSELNLPPMAALSKIYVVHGKPALDGQTALAVMQRHGVLIEVLESTDKVCRVRGRRYYGEDPEKANEQLWVQMVEEFTSADAQRMGLLNQDNYRKQPRVMLRWKAIGALGRILAADLLNGLDMREDLDATPAEMFREREPAPRQTVRVASVKREMDDRPPLPEAPMPAQKAPQEVEAEPAPPEPKPKRKAAKKAVKVISDAQRKRLWAITNQRARDVGVDPLEIRDVVRSILEKHGVPPKPDDKDGGPSSSLIPVEMYDSITAAIESWVPVEAGETPDLLS